MNETHVAPDETAIQGQNERNNFLTPKQCAEQFRRYAQSHPNEGSKHSLGFCANFLDEFCIQSPEADTKRLDWLERIEQERTKGEDLPFCVINYPSHKPFWGGTFREAIDAAMEGNESQ